MTSNLRRLREEAGLSRMVLARQVPCSDVAIQRWENGDRAPGLQMARQVAQALTVFLGRIVTMEDLWPPEADVNSDTNCVSAE